jgi:aminomethyltransferase
MIDDVIVYRLPESLSSTFGAFNQYLVIINASNREPDIAWMKDQASQSAPDVNVSLVSDRYGLLALQGPKALDVLEKFGIGADSVPKRFWVNELTLANVPVLVARTGYTGEDGVELIVPIEHVSTVWGELLCQGEPLGLQPAGLAARDILRLEAGLPLYGHELSLNETPLEAGLGWSVKLEKASDFIGKDVLVGQKQSGLPKRLIGFVLRKKTIPRQHDALVLNGQIIGEVTSGSVSPVLDQSIGMGYVNGTVVVEAGTVIEVEVRGQRIEAEIVKLPFYKAQAVPTK